MNSVSDFDEVMNAYVLMEDTEEFISDDENTD